MQGIGMLRLSKQDATQAKGSRDVALGRQSISQAFVLTRISHGATPPIMNAALTHLQRKAFHSVSLVQPGTNSHF